MNWINANEKMPTITNKSYLVWCPDNLCTYAAYLCDDDNVWKVWGTNNKRLEHMVTQWAEMPQPLETIMNKLYRLNDELLTIVEVDRDSLNIDPPIDYWLPVMYGAGSYIYVKSEDEAKAMLREIIECRIVELNAKLLEGL